MDNIELFSFNPEKSFEIPLFVMSVSAGIPVPVDNDIDKVVDLNEFLVEHPAATFFAKINGSNFDRFGISHGDILVIDSVVEPQDRKIVVVLVNDELMIRFYRILEGKPYLQSHNKQFVPLDIDPKIEYSIIGVVTKVIHSL